MLTERLSPQSARSDAFDGISVADRRVVRRSEGLGEGAEGDGSGDFGALAAGAEAEVAVLEAVAVAFEAEDL